MTLAWFGLVTLAVYSARYMKEAFANNLIKQKIWFQVNFFKKWNTILKIHRTLNIIALLLIITALIFILIGKDLRWTGPWFTYSKPFDNPGSLHSLVILLKK